MYFVKSVVAKSVKITIEHDSNASATLYHIIIATVPKSIRTPENIELNDCDMTFEMLSASLVIRLIKSPCEWVSV